ncbi:response regulator transcription factor [Nocardioides stalactiti]|uniref:response regulator transcription factor n=1 Tax=Nocardioides stalactiti TaxID=2755356 RepID=UPI0016049B7D|nr:response regulator transcription factor [Nocardioides stalactiti]
MLTVGVCEDHEPIRRALARGLRHAGHEAVLAHDGREALIRFAPAVPLDVIVMDIGLPDADGRDVVQALKSAGQDAPVLFLTALDALHDKLQGFAAGADDYVVKPFEMSEVIARVGVLAARPRPTRAPGLAGLDLDPASHSIRTSSGEALLSPTEFRMLAAIAARPGEVVRRRAVVAAAWPDGAIVSENTVDSYIRRVRSKLASVDAAVRIETVRGVGFRVC